MAAGRVSPTGAPGFPRKHGRGDYPSHFLAENAGGDGHSLCYGSAGPDGHAAATSPPGPAFDRTCAVHRADSEPQY